ncbi:MAG TPA: hypothetical protein VLL76_02710, partial [Candidatus Omnitrophota bacterium]|nr:hypothetical protein [Candidatus Omnitrophota bacterium]
AYVGEVLARRLAMFRVAEPVFPSAAYRHEQPFFLFSPAFAPVACAYVAEVVMVECRDALERHVYRHLEPRFGADDGALKAVLDEARPQIWKILAERLTKLAGHHRNAEAKLDAARAGGGDGPEFAEVEVPVTHPRVFRVLGVEFVLGNRTTTRKMKVRVKASTELDRDEMRALDLITRLGDMAADEGVELPDSCDFLFLRSLLEFDARKYGQTQKELVALAGHEETTRAYLFERLKAVEEHYSNTLADVMVLMLFAAGAECRFGFKEMLDVCLGTAKSMDAVATQRPFLVAEIGRRPRELAFQLREALRRRYDENTVAAATRQLLEVWEAMPRSRFERDLDAALTVFSAFPVAFAGDPDEPALSEIGHILHRALAGKSPEPRATIDAVVAAYAPLAQRLREAVRG